MLSLMTVIMAVILIGTAFMSDIRSMTIPNWLNGGFLAAGMALHCIFGGWTGWLYALSGAAAGLLPLLLLYALKGIGAGDVKFFAALGAVVGAETVLLVFLYAVLYGGLLGVVLLLVNRSFGRRLLLGAVSVLVAESRLQAWESSIASGSSLRFPFMLAVVPGAITAWYMLPL